MPKKPVSAQKQLLAENEDLRARLDEAVETLRTIRNNEVDAIIVPGVSGERVYTLKGADHIYRVLIEAMSEGALTLAMDGMILYVNQSLAEMLKIPLEKVIGSSIQAWIAPDSQPILQSLLEKDIHNNRRMQLDFIASDGSQVPVSLSVSNLFEDEILVSFCLVATDLTEQKLSNEIKASEKLAHELLAASNQSRRALLSVVEDQKRTQDALSASEAELRALFEAMTDVVIIYDTEGRYIKVAPTNPLNLTRKPEEMLGKYIHEFLPKEQADYIVTKINEAIQTNQIVSGEYPLQIGGQEKWFGASVSPLSEDTVIWVAHDITERKEAEDTLRKSEEKYRQLFETMFQGVVYQAADGDIISANPAAERVLGLTLDQMQGRISTDPRWKAIHEDGSDFPGNTHPSMIALTTGKEVRDVVMGVFNPEQEEYGWININAVPNFKPGEPVPYQVYATFEDITERKRAEVQIQIQMETMGALYDLSRKLLEMEDFNLMLDLVTRSAVEYAHVTFSCFLLLDQDDLVMRAFYPVRVLNKELQVDQREPLADHPFCQRVLDGNIPLVLQSQDPELGEFVFILHNIAQNLCIVPLHFNEQPFGILILGEARDTAREPFTAKKIRLAESIADQAASALHRALLGEQAKHRLQRIACLREIDSTIAASFDLRLSLEVIFKNVMEQLEVDAVAVLVVNSSLQRLEYKGGRGFRSDAIEHVEQRLDEGQAGQSIRDRRMIYIPDVAASVDSFAQSAIMKAEQFSVYIAIPLIIKGKANGVLEIYHRLPLDPDQEWFDFLNSLAGQAAIAIDNDQLFYGLQRSNLELGLAYDATIEGWSHALDLRDKETEGHTQRVTEMTVKLAHSFNISNDVLRLIRWGALLHDIGKMGVPDAILLKPGPLTDEEWVKMKKHPVFAFEMLMPIHYLKDALDIPYCHHEKWDGTGYPRGLKGEQIPLAARIFAVVDVYDALTSDRPYRKAWTEEKALEHIRSESGTHFDPQVVKLFLENQVN